MNKPAILLFLAVLTLTDIFAQTERFYEENDQKKIQKRYIHPKSKHLTISAGFGFTATRIQDPGSFLTEGLFMQNNTYLPNIMYEHGLVNNFFAEAGYSYFGVGISREIIHGEGRSSFYAEYFQNHDAQIGVGFRVVNKRNYHFFNVHAGVFMGFANEDLDDLPLVSRFIEIDPATNAEYFITQSINAFSPVSFGPYVGISKELRLTGGIRFFVKYVQRFGVINTMSGTIKPESDEIVFDNDPATFQVRGDGAFITGGLKFLLNKKILEYPSGR